MQELEDCLVRDYFICYHIIQGIHSIDFLEVFVYLSIYLSIYICIYNYFHSWNYYNKDFNVSGFKNKIIWERQKAQGTKNCYICSL